MYTLELAGDGEIKISCPSLPLAGTEQRKDPVKDSQKEVPIKGMHPPAQTQNVPNNHAPQTIQQPQYPYFPSYPNYFHPVKPESTPTEKPSSPPETGKNNVKPQQPVDPPAKQPVPPKSQNQQSFYHYPYYFQPQQAAKPSQPEAPKDQVQQSFVTPPESKKPSAAQNPSQPNAPHGQVYQPYPFYHYPFYPQPESENKPASKPAATPGPETPQSQVNQQFYHFPSLPQPETGKHPEKPTGAAKPQQPEAPQSPGHQQFYLYPYYFYSGENSQSPGAVKPPQVLQPEAPKGQAQWPFFPKQDHKEAPAEKPAAVQKPSQPEAPQTQVYPKQEPGKQPATKPSQPEAPKGQVHQQPFPQPEPGKQPASEKPAQPQVPQSPVYPSFYHPYFFHQPKPKNPPAEKPTGGAETPEPSKPAPAQSHENQFAFYQYPHYPKQDFGKQPAKEPAQPPHQEDPKGKVHQPEPQNPPDKKPAPASNPQPEVPHFPGYKPFYPYHYPYGYPYSYPFYSHPEPSDQQNAGPKPSSSETELPKPYDQSSKTEGTGTDDNTSTVKNPQWPQYPKYVTVPPATSMKDPHQTGSLPSAPDNQQPSKGSTDPQTPSHKPPVYCPQYCPSGLSSCCVQIAFHQHLHHILPAKETTQLYQGLPFLPSMFYSGSDQGLVSAPFPQKPTDTTSEAPPASKSVPSQPSLSVKGNQQFHQPPDGNFDALKGSNPSRSTNQKPIHTSPHPVYPYQLYLPQDEGLKKFPQSQIPAHNIVPSQSQAPSKGKKSQVSWVSQHPVGSSKLVSTEQRPSDIESSDSGPKYPKVIVDPNRNQLLQYLLQNAQGLPNHSHSLKPQPIVRTLQDPNHQPETTANPEPQSFVLLQHGPPGRESYDFNRSPLPSTDLIHDEHLELHYPQKAQQPEWLEEGLSSSSPENANFMTRSGGGSSPSWHISAPADPHFEPLSQNPSFGADNLKPRFLDPWKPMAPGSLGQEAPSPVHPEVFQQWSSAADEPQNGM